MGLILPWWTRWAVLAVALLAAAAFGAAKMHAHDQKRYDALHAEFEGFKDQVRVNGLTAKAAAKEKEKSDKDRKDKADAKHAKTVARLSADVERLRNANPPSSFVPAAPAGSSRPDLACFDRAEYQRTDGSFTTRARGLAEEGTASTVDLDSAKGWAQGF